MAREDTYGSFGSVPKGDSSGGGGNNLGVEASPAAFGSQVAQAQSNLGETVGKVASNFQSIYNDSTARDAVTQASMKLADLEFEYKKQKGLNAANAFPVFQKNAQQLMTDTASSMPNLNTEKLFKDQFSYEVNGAIHRSGSWAADQTDQAEITSLSSSIDSKTNLMAMHITDPESRANNIIAIRDNVFQLAHARGLDPDSADNLVSKSIGAAYSSGIRTVINSDPDKAKVLFDEAMNGKFMATRNGKQVEVPYLADEQRAAISSEMQGEFRRQEGEQLQTARSYASQGVDFDKNALVESMKNTGRSDDYIKAELGRLDQVKNVSYSADARYNVEKNIDNDESLATSGLPVQGNYDEASLRIAYPHDPTKVQDILNHVNNLHQVAGFVGEFPTKTPTEIYHDLDKFNPNADNSYVARLQQIEGSGKNPDASSSGKYQFTDATWIDSVRKYAPQYKDSTNAQILALKKNDDSFKDQIFNAYTQDNKNELGEKLGHTPTDAETYLAHQQGVAGANALLSNPGMKAIDALVQAGVKPDKARDSIVNNGGTEDMSAQDFTKKWEDKFNSITPSGNYDERHKLYDTMKNAADSYVKNLYDDPAGTLVSKDPVLTGQLNDGLQDMSKLGTYIDSVSARQISLEVPEAYRSALPKETATNISNSIIANPQNAPEVINGLAQKTGDHWPQVYASLVKQGGLPSFYQSVAQLGSDPSTQRDATLLARWAGEDTKGKTDTDLLGSDVVSSMKKNISADPSVTNFTSSLRDSGASKTQIDGVINSVEALAFAKKFYDKDPNAVQNAIESFTYGFDYVGGARVPSNVSDAVNKNAKVLLNNIENNAAVPPAYATGGAGNLTPKEYYSWLKANPTWVTSPNVDALYLKDPNDRLVRGKDGKPLTVPFSLAAPVGVSKTLTDLGLGGSGFGIYP